MDILNFISWIRGKRKVTSVDPAKTVIPLGVKDGRRDDDYLAVAMTVEDFAAQITPQPTYKVYTALLSQTGTNPPVATVLENTLDADITYQYSAPGSYAIVTPNNTFIPNKTYTVLQLWGDDGVTPRLGYIGWSTINELYLTLTDTNGTLINALGDNQNPKTILTSIEIRVYN